MAELTLDDVERQALVSEFDRVRVTQLVWREAPPHAGFGRESPQLRASRVG